MIKKLLITVSGLIIINAPALAFASHVELPDPGTTPDSALYFLKSWREQIQVFFTLDAKNKAEQFLHLAAVRLAEYQKMIEKGKKEIAERTLAKYEEQIKRATDKLKELKDKKEEVKDLEDKIKAEVSGHEEILKENLAKAPEEAKKGLQQALESSKKAMTWDRATGTWNKAKGTWDEQ
ncbi:MAG: DUF5667 domain-containing protein [bacterium]|nr:DUF5667 domain-containing protein [bacterium]